MKIDWGFSIYQVFIIGVPEDMIETWKYLHGQYHVNQMPLQRDTNTTTRGHSMKLRKERCLKRQRSNFFRHRVVNRWNMLTDNIVTSPSVNIFKNRLDAFWHVHKCEQSDDFPRTCTKHPSRPANRLLAYLRAEEDVYSEPFPKGRCKKGTSYVKFKNDYCIVSFC